MLAALTLLLAACGGDSTSTPAASTAQTGAQPAAAVELDAVVKDLSKAVEAALGVRDALKLASGDPDWTRVNRACEVYPAGPRDAALGVAMKVGLRTKAAHPELWPPEVTELDSTAATTCFIIGAAQSIPPGARVDETFPTTAEIASQSLVNALAHIPDPSPRGLRTLMDSHQKG